MPLASKCLHLDDQRRFIRAIVYRTVRAGASAPARARDAVRRFPMFLLAPAIATSMSLICPGVWTGTSTSSDLVWNTDGGGYVNAFVDHKNASEADARVELHGNDGYVRITWGKKSQSWPLSDVHVDGGVIQARIRFNFLDRPHVTIDPSAGRLRIRAMNSGFLGVCRNAGAPPETLGSRR
ncbi:MAG TPA: hypothetical protein VFW19_06375 [Allosphingosinicella sp.]|nr:hypothetical protein [Allosphingosinicella sp.]